MRSTRQRLGIAACAGALVLALSVGWAGDAAAERGPSQRRDSSVAAFDGLARWIDGLLSWIVAPDSSPAPGPEDTPEVRPPDGGPSDDPGGPIIEPVRPPAGPG